MLSPRRVRADSFHLLAGTRWTMVELKARFRCQGHRRGELSTFEEVPISVTDVKPKVRTFGLQRQRLQ